jgi:DnaJ-class molecular chaperone
MGIEDGERNEGEENLSDEEILGILPGSTLQEIRDRFKEVTSDYANNPNASNPENQQKFLKTEAAYKRLREAAKKAEEGKK